MRAPALIQIPSREERRALIGGAALSVLLLLAVLPAMWQACAVLGA